MGKHERSNDKTKPASSDDAATPPDPVGATEVAPKMALLALPKPEAPAVEAASEPPNGEAPKLEAPKLEISKLTATVPVISRTAAPVIAMAKIEAVMAVRAAIEPPKIELASIASPRMAPDIEESEPAVDAPEPEPHLAAEEAPPEPPAEAPAPRVNRFTMLAAALALSAGLGGMVGVLAATSFVRSGAAPSAVAGRTGLEEFQALKESVVQARVDLAAMKASIDAGNRNAGAQFTKLGERIDRMERGQAEPTARLSKAIDTLDRLARADAAAQARDVTGSITPPAPPAVAGLPRPGGGLDGWVVRDVRRGTALIEGRMGVIEVDQGDIVPGLGRVDAIRKQPDGRWVVVTTRGMITSAR
jgi:hypothetical protein